ncbi:aspartyl/asparaginyl beta-hydroxylase domain-containing protein [Kitasatospora hibisci]|uniref:aspartyl/asparaginyl beta-hydroxylase domain-containing protein n=1 Tax=Kitasatospora hibisci TaxID=3369522 RepID=UPI003754348C
MNAPARPGPVRLAEAARLTPAFDADRLARELAAVTSHRWQRQRIHAPGGSIGEATAIDWRVLPLRSPGGDGERTDPGGPGPVDFAPTPWLDRMPYLREILAGIPAPLNAVRLMALGPGAASQPHCDPKYRLDRGFVRLHIPIVTHPEAVLVLDGAEHCWQPGEFCYGDFSREHLVRNTGRTVRVHTVIDALLTEELVDLFPTAWQAALAEADVLFNRPALRATAFPSPLPYSVLLPSGFTDFDHDDPLEGQLEPAQITQQPGGQLTLTTAGRLLALAPTGDGEYRFAGWSEQRTLTPADDGVLLQVRRGRTTRNRHLPAATTTH